MYGIEQKKTRSISIWALGHRDLTVARSRSLRVTVQGLEPCLWQLGRRLGLAVNAQLLFSLRVRSQYILR